MTKYIVISTNVDWRHLSWEKLIKDNKVDYYSDLPYKGNIFLKKSIKFFYSCRLNSKIRIPCRQILYKGILKALNINKYDEVKIIFYDRSRGSYDFSLIKYLRKKNHNIKIGYLFSDIVSKSGAKYFKIIKKLNKIYDKVFSFDKKDSEKYGFDYSYLIYDIIAPKCKLKNFTNDVFLVAQAKDRLNELLSICDFCFNLGLRTDFIINKVSNQFISTISKKNIQLNQFVPYREVIERLQKSKCIIDIMQKDSYGITLNIVEAIFFNKKIITNNMEIFNEPFYDSSRILVLSCEDSKKNIKLFLDTPMKPYTDSEKQYFSGIKIFERL